MKTKTDIIDIASSYIGTVEKPNNNVIFNTSYYGKEVSGDAYPWCCVFIWYVFKQANASDLFYDGKKTALCQTLADWFKEKKQWYQNNPKVGDIVFFKFGKSSRYTDHVGIVIENKPDGSIVTIEGNTSDKDNRNGGMVLNRIRSKNIVGYGRPKYSDENSKIVLSAKNTESKKCLTYPCRGVDISKYQKNLDYDTLKKNGVDFAILKVVDKQLSKESEFETHYNGCTRAGIPIMGVYQYSYCQTVEKARIDAQAVIKALNGRKVPIILDIEDSVQKNLGHLLIDIINAYQDVIEAAGISFYIYSGYSFVKSFIVPYLKDLKCKDFWIARYYKGHNPMGISEPLDDSKKPTIQGINLIGWQFTSSGIVAGANGQRLDCNIFYKSVGSSSSSPATKQGVVTANSLRVRSNPNTNSETIGYLKKGEVINITNTDPASGWYQIGNGWVSNSYIKIL